MTRPEQKLQTAIVVALRKRFDCFVSAVPNGGARTPLEALAFKDAGLTAGTPDLLVCGPQALFAFIEVKAQVQVRERGVPAYGRMASLDPAQKAVVQRLRAYGHRVAVVGSVEDAVAACEAVGFPPRPAAAARSADAAATGF